MQSRSPCQNGRHGPIAGARDMATNEIITPRAERSPRLALGFLAGAVAVLTFHQGVIALLTSHGALSSSVYSMRPVPPLGVPQIVSSAFWGGVWGVVFAAFAPRRRGARYWLFAIALGAVALPLAGWFVVAPLKGLPVASGWVPSRMALGMLINGAWGIGIGVVFALLTMRGHRH
jgi:hypothetical protein